MSLLAVLGVLALPASATGSEQFYFFEETAEANWSVPQSARTARSSRPASWCAARAVRDNSGVTHQVAIDVDWTGAGPITTSVNPPQGFRVGMPTRKQRAATATGTVVYDGDILVSGEANHRITPFIRTDEDRYTATG